MCQWQQTLRTKQLYDLLIFLVMLYIFVLPFRDSDAQSQSAALTPLQHIFHHSLSMSLSCWYPNVCPSTCFFFFEAGGGGCCILLSLLLSLYFHHFHPFFFYPIQFNWLLHPSLLNLFFLLPIIFSFYPSLSSLFSFSPYPFASPPVQHSALVLDTLLR